MSEHCLDMSDVGTVIEHVGRHRMAEQVATTGFVDACLCFVFSDAFADITISGFVAFFAEIRSKDFVANMQTTARLPVHALPA